MPEPPRREPSDRGAQRMPAACPHVVPCLNCRDSSAAPLPGILPVWAIVALRPAFQPRLQLLPGAYSYGPI